MEPFENTFQTSLFSLSCVLVVYACLKSILSTIRQNNPPMCILSVGEATTWKEASQKCQDAGGDLVIIKGSRKNDKIVELGK